MVLRQLIFGFIGVWFLVVGSCGFNDNAQERADRFLSMYDSLSQKLYSVASEASWKAYTDVTDQHIGERIAADRAFGAFAGSDYVINETKALLSERATLTELTERQLEKVLLSAAQYPGTIPDVVDARIEHEAKQSAILDSFTYCAERGEGGCRKKVTPNRIDSILRRSHDLRERRSIWELSKQVGPPLKSGLVELSVLELE